MSTIQKRGPGRPPRKTNSTINKRGIIDVPDNVHNLIELTHHDPSTFKCIFTTIRNLKVIDIYFKFCTDHFVIMAHDHMNNPVYVKIYGSAAIKKYIDTLSVIQPKAQKTPTPVETEDEVIEKYSHAIMRRDDDDDTFGEGSNKMMDMYKEQLRRRVPKQTNNPSKINRQKEQVAEPDNVLEENVHVDAMASAEKTCNNGDPDDDLVMNLMDKLGSDQL